MRTFPAPALLRKLVVPALALGASACSRAPGCSDAPAPPPATAPDAGGSALAPVFEGLALPVAFAVAPGDAARRLFVVEKDGLVAVLERKDGKLVRSPTPLLDLRGQVSRGHDEQGLLGLAFHPRFQQKPLVYVNFTNGQGATEVVEYRLPSPDAPAADKDSARGLLEVPQPYPNHNGGHLLFGPDDDLWIGLGDGGKRYDPHGNGQNPEALLGKMLRLDVDSACDCSEKSCERCVDGSPLGPKAELQIVATGLRNPWRYSFDRETDALYIADVGQDRWEEIDVVPTSRVMGGNKANFGWAKMEGNHCASGLLCDSEGLIPAVLEYDHDTGCSITGGFVYRGKALPALVGQYFYSDYCTAILRSLTWKDGRVTATADYKPLLDPAGKLAKVSSFGEDHDGELYIVSEEGTLWQLVPGSPR
ncbi:MAG: PQQ-dependent sugar dehydrogenase [Polyangiaceae bacterium]